MTAAIDDAMYDKLAGASGVTALVSTRIYRGAAPQGATAPYVIYAVQAGGDENLTPADSINLLYQVRGVSKVSAAEAAQIGDAIRAALHRQTLSITGWTNYWMARTAQIQTVETTPEGLRFWHDGGLYRVRVD
jgi:hypothetical protein